MDIIEVKAIQDFVNGTLSGEGVNVTQKLYKDAKSFYASIDESLSDDTIMYEVYQYSVGDAAKKGNLDWGITVMKPVYVQGECNVTRGHFHNDLDCDEIYFCMTGEGLLLYMDEKGECYAEKMAPGSVHHIDGKLAHRLVNTGDVDMRIGCCWPTTAGHDYARIEAHPFTVRIFRKGDEIEVKDVR